MGSALSVLHAAPNHMILVVTALMAMLTRVECQEAIRYVASFSELQRASSDGVRVIVVTEHLDLAGTQTSSSPDAVLTLSASTEAILVRFRLHVSVRASENLVVLSSRHMPRVTVLTLLHALCTLYMTSVCSFLITLYFLTPMTRSGAAQPFVCTNSATLRSLSLSLLSHYARCSSRIAGFLHCRVHVKLLVASCNRRIVIVCTSQARENKFTAVLRGMPIPRYASR
jgi:hypothetical protein